MASVQRIHPRLSTAALAILRKPSGALGVWSQDNAIFAASGARYGGPDAGTAQQAASPTFAAIPNGATHSVLVAQILSDPLREQTIAAGDWSVAFAAQVANAGATFTWSGKAALFVVNGFTGQRRATIFDTTTIGSTGRTSTGERTCLATIAGAATSVRTGDYLALELGVAVTNAAAALAPQVSLFTDGTTPISTDNVAATSALSVLEAPSELLLSLPQAGEPPNPTLTQPQTVALLKEHFPPYSDTLYDWDASDANIYAILQYLGDWLKIYGYDQIDRILREVSPLTCVEMLPAWESALGISLGQAALRLRSVEQRRAQVLARLRELGPLTVYNVASIFAQLAQYAPGTVPEIFEFDHATLITANETSYPVAAAIPEDTDFGPSNLQSYTPTLLDGGVVWNAGALLSVELSNTSTAGLRFELQGPDFTVARWEGGPSGLVTSLRLRSPAHADKSIHGPWRLRAYRITGAPAVNLLSWRLYVLGKQMGGRGQAKYNWSVYLDPAHQQVDRRDIDSTLARITQSYARSWVVYDKTSVPGTTNRPGRFFPG